MFDGKILRGLTGTPMRRIAFANSSFADAEPEPLTLANLTTKSLTAASGFMFRNPLSRLRERAGVRACSEWNANDSRDLPRRRTMTPWACIRHLEQKLLHVPRAGRTSLRAQPAVQAYIFIFHNHAPGLELAGHIQILRRIQRLRRKVKAQIRFLTVARERDAVHRTNVHARIAFDADVLREHGLDVAVEAALRFLPRRFRIEAELDFELDALQRLLRIRPRHFVAEIRRNVVVVAPLVDTHLLRDHFDRGQRAILDVFA